MMRDLDNYYLTNNFKGRRGKNWIDRRVVSEICVQEVISKSSICFRSLTLPAWNPIQLVSRVGLLCSISNFRSLTLPAWNPIQRVSLVRLCSISITDIACMKFHPGSESCAPPLLDFNHWHCLPEIPSSSWVVCASSARFRSLTLPAWNPIQGVSHVRLLCSISTTDIACLKSHPVRESCAPPLLDFDHWHCLHEIPSRKWVMCTSTRFRSLTLPAWNPIQRVSCVGLLCSISITDIACMKSHPGSESCAPPLLDFDHWHCLH